MNAGAIKFGEIWAQIASGIDGAKARRDEARAAAEQREGAYIDGAWMDNLGESPDY